MHNIKMDAFYAKYAEKISENSIPCPNGECKVWIKAKKQSGYGVIKCKMPTNEWQTLHVHRLSFIISNRLTTGDIVGRQVSHLCHNKACTNSDHLSLEPAQVNRSREICVNRKTCTGHDNYPDCMLRLKLES